MNERNAASGAVASPSSVKAMLVLSSLLLVDHRRLLGFPQFISNKAIMTKLNIDVRAFYYDQDIPQPKMTKGEMAYLLHPSKYPRVQLPRDRRYLYDPYFPVRPLINFFDSLRCYMQTCSTPDSGIDLNEQLDEEKEQKKKKISLAPGPDTVYFAGKHGHLVRRRDEDDDDGDIPHGDSFWLDS